MDVAECVHRRLQLEDTLAKIDATDVLESDTIENARRRAMRDEHVGAVRNEGPFLGDRFAAVDVKRPIEKTRLPRRSPETAAVDRDAGILEIREPWPNGAQMFARDVGVGLKKKIVIARDDDEAAVRQRLQPGGKIDYVGFGPGVREIPTVDEHVAVGHVEPIVKRVCVGGDYESQNDLDRRKIAVVGMLTC